MNLDSIWKELDSITQESKNTTQQSNDITCCKNCESHNIGFQTSNFVCFDCGYVINDIVLESSFVNYDNNSDNVATSKKFGNSKSYNKLQKMQNWYMWTSQEKNTYKLQIYTQELCTKLSILEQFIPNICTTVINTMNAIKKHDGTKRAKVKDGIILVCIHYELKKHGNQLSLSYLSKQLNLDIKYITKAENIMLELINNNKLKLDKQMLLETKNPFDYVLDVIQKNDISVPPKLLKQVKLLIKICEENDLLLDHTPLSIGVCCFYYILKMHEFSIDVKLFSDLYDLSVVTVVKTFNKLKQHELVIKNLTF